MAAGLYETFPDAVNVKCRKVSAGGERKRLQRVSVCVIVQTEQSLGVTYMRKRKLLIVHESEDFCEQVYEELIHNFDIRICHTAREAKDAVDAFEPEALILDLFLSYCDPLEVLEYISLRIPRLISLVMTPVQNDYVCAKFREYNVGYAFMIPCSAKKVSRRMLDMVKSKYEQEEHVDEQERMLYQLLTDVGIDTGTKTFPYILLALKCRVENPHAMITKEIYPEIIARLGGTKGKIEKAIERPIRGLWERERTGLCRKLFPEDTKPSNDTFLRRLGNYARSTWYVGSKE